MRQAGVIAAGALYALEHNIDRLAEDHASAQLLANAVRKAEGLRLVSDPVETNIIMLAIDSKADAAGEFVELLRDKGVSALALGPSRVRLVTHLDVTSEQTRQAAEIIQHVALAFARQDRAKG
jgi:threonine aldolase